VGTVRATVAAAVLLLPSLAVAQSSLRLELTPGIGYYAPRNDLGAAAPAGGAWYLRLERIDPTVFLGASAQLDLPGSDLGLRLQGIVAWPSDAEGFFACHPGLGCPDVLLRTTAEVTVMAALADAVYSPFESRSPVRPFIALGAGVKRYSYSWPEPAVLLDAGDYSEAGLALHVGAGFDLVLAGAPLRLEVGDYWSDEVRRPWATDIAWSARPRRNAQHDLAVSLGWSVLRF